MQVPRRRLEIVTSLERCGAAIRPAERLAVEREEVFEMPRVEVGADSAAPSALGDDEQELPRRIRVPRHERVAAEAFAPAVGEDVVARRGRQDEIGDACGLPRRGRRAGTSSEITGERGLSELTWRDRLATGRDVRR